MSPTKSIFMDIAKIVEKALKGEAYEADIKDATPEDRTKVALAIRDAAEVAAKTNLEKASATAKEAARREEKATEKSVLESFQSEQLAAAKKDFLADSTNFPLTDAQKAQLEATFKSTKVGKDEILKELQVFYVNLNAEQFLADRKKQRNNEKGAYDFNADQAGAGGGGSGGAGDDKYSPAAKDLLKQWHANGLKSKTIDQAQKIVDRGVNWQTRNLAV